MLSSQQITWEDNTEDNMKITQYKFTVNTHIHSEEEREGAGPLSPHSGVVQVWAIWPQLPFKVDKVKLFHPIF
jgi:hypothetical protein